MRGLLMVSLLGCVLLGMTPARAAGDAVVGSWRLTSYTLQVVGHEPTEPFGRDARGSLVLTPDRFIIVVTAGGRKPATNDDERSRLVGSMIAYTGTYRVDGDKLVTKVDTSWNEVFSGRLETQTRFFEVKGDELTIRTPEIESAVRPGDRIVAILKWGRER